MTKKTETKTEVRVVPLSKQVEAGLKAIAKKQGQAKAVMRAHIWKGMMKSIGEIDSIRKSKPKDLAEITKGVDKFIKANKDVEFFPNL